MAPARTPTRSRRAIDRSNIGIGMITLAAIATAAGAGIFLPGMLRSPLLEYQITVPAGDDLSGLAKGTPVSIAGLVRGEVIDVEDRIQPDDTTSFVITIEIEPDPPIYSDARVVFTRDVISNRASIDFVRPGAPDEGRRPLAPGNDILRNSEAGDASLFLTPAAQRAYENTWASLERAREAWGPMLDDAERRGTQVKDAFQALRATIGDDVATYEGRITALRERYAALQDRYATLQERWAEAQAEFGRTREMLSDEGQLGRLRGLLRVIGERWGVLGKDGEGLTPIADAIGRQWEAIKASAERIDGRLATIGETLTFRHALADLTIAAEQFARLTGGGLSTALRAIIPGDEPRDDREEAMDDLARTLLLGMEQAKRSEEALRHLLDGSADVFGSMGDLDRLREAIERLDQLEQALWHLRIGPKGPAEAR